VSSRCLVVCLGPDRVKGAVRILGTEINVRLINLLRNVERLTSTSVTLDISGIADLFSSYETDEQNF